MKITDIEVNESIELGDNFDIELGNTIIESCVVGFMDDGVVLEADDKALALLGIGGALLESVDITEVSLGDYSKKAQISRALAQIDQKFYPNKPGSEQTIAKRTRGLERAKVRNDQAKAKYAAQAQQARADAIAKDKENLPTLEKYLAQLKAEFDPYYEYSDDHRVWTRNRDLKGQITALERRIADAKGMTEENIASSGLSVGQEMARDGITYSPEKEKELIRLMGDYMKKRGYSLNKIRYLLSYDEDFIPDQLSELPKQSVTEGAGNIGNRIKDLYQKIYDLGDDAVEFMYYDSPIFAQYWDEYEGDLDSIIAEVDPKELQVIYSELQSAAENEGLTEKLNPQSLTRGFVKEKDMGWYKLVAVGDAISRGVDDPPTMTIRAMSDKTTIGELQLKIAHGQYLANNPGAEALVASGVYVEPEYQRKGIASSMYQFAKELGNDVIASFDQSDDAKAMWAGMKQKGLAENFADGKVKEQMHTDAERMELAEFVDKYGDEDWVKEFWHSVNDDINEAKYQGREVPLGKPMQGDVKKSKVYVRGPKGNVVKVNFGDKNMRIKKSNPKRRKSFRARHNCANPGPRWKARYWSCRAW